MPATDVIRAGALNGYLPLMEELGQDPAGPLLRCDLDPRALGDPEALIPVRAAARLLEESALATGCEELGLRLAQHQDPSALGPLAILIRNAPTVEDAIADASRYIFVHSPAYEITLADPSPLSSEWVAVRFDVRLGGLPHRQLLDGCLAVTYRLAQALAPGREPRAVSLPHTPRSSLRDYRRFYSVPVHFGQPSAALHCDRDVLRLVPRETSPLLRQLALEHMESRGAAPMALDASDRVRQALLHTMGAGRGTKEEVGMLLSMHPRTVQRKLRREGTTFETIREEVYSSAALRLLRDSDVTLTQVALALGYSDQSALARCCRRWFGKTPTELRAGSSGGDTSVSYPAARRIDQLQREIAERRRELAGLERAGPGP